MGKKYGSGMSASASSNLKRRDFLKFGASIAGGLAATGLRGSLLSDIKKPMAFKISLAEWSLHRALQSKEIDHLDFYSVAKKEFDISAVEYVNTFFFNKAKDATYLKEMKTRADDLGVKNLLIMCDSEGNLGDPDDSKRKTAVENHYKWAEAAKFLECHSIRVNARSEGSYDEQIELAADGLRRLAEFGDSIGINTIVENHGGLSSNGKWLAAVMEKVDHPRMGTLPDFGNFRLEGEEWYDRYQGVRELMPYAKAVSAKSHEFDSDGNEINTDYYKMMKIVLDASYNSHVGIEYEGTAHSEMEGIRLTLELLKKVRASID
ncbi:MAG TPA: sugar phosphate isomerase/epimerase family protein [Candidatus Marinimicrobia bacterium]|jgi:sugar phosphate isomerase/epimerase|nr:sugar phosphate isomerase/epimerase family protein [Candidatus Neomarinimicrobiota bacterium]MDP7127028.1 sugar phosphate isomerase/epimerase family protein [Candidatus Neomarinimicrobiota bacterium]HJL78272.1 sugar phosphate isomerase/epimerase family protein [Candidatus Neomarinimicrobiota bacterium]HJN69355.1 sugar phosphate isomerase/epimerase family protein [Candidatus Neomarinimicrobiota bacterium]